MKRIPTGQDLLKQRHMPLELSLPLNFLLLTRKPETKGKLGRREEIAKKKEKKRIVREERMNKTKE